MARMLCSAGRARVRAARTRAVRRCGPAGRNVWQVSEPRQSRGAGAGSLQRADLLLGDDAFDVLALALDAIAAASVGFDRQAADDGIDAALFQDGAALRALQLVKYVVIDRVAVRHRLVFLSKRGF